MKAILVLVLGCGPEKEPDEREVAPIGSPFEMNTSDTVVDDPSLIPGNLYGEVVMTGTLPFWKATCDQTFTLTGVPFTGYCPGCVFNFELATLQTRDDGEDCPSAEDMAGFFSRSAMAFQFWDWRFNILLAYNRYFSGGGIYGGSVNNDPALLWGVAYYPDPLWYPVAYEGSYFGTITDVTDTTIDWTMDWVYYYYGKNELHAVGHAYIVQ